MSLARGGVFILLCGLGQDQSLEHFPWIGSAWAKVTDEVLAVPAQPRPQGHSRGEQQCRA